MVRPLKISTWGTAKAAPMGSILTPKPDQLIFRISRPSPIPQHWYGGSGLSDGGAVSAARDGRMQRQVGKSAWQSREYYRRVRQAVHFLILRLCDLTDVKHIRQ